MLWIDNRWPVSSLLHISLDEEIIGGPSFAYVFGRATLLLFLLQAVTGISQFFYHAPTLDHAYESVGYLQTEVPFGWLIHSVHYWGANAMVVLVGLHMIAFGETNGLTQQAISDIEAYILRLNGMNRAQIAHPGLQPLPFFYLTLIVFGLAGVALAGLGIRMRVSRAGIRG
jgi:hypothetical protein